MTPHRLARRMLRAFLRAYPRYRAPAARAIADSLSSGVFWQAGGLRWETWGKREDDNDVAR